VLLAGVLLDAVTVYGETGNPVLADFAKLYKVDQKKIAASVDKEIEGRKQLRAQNPPAAPKVDPRKESIAKLDTLNKPAPKKSAPAKKTAPAKKLAVPRPTKRVPKKSAKKGGKK
jgi:hypothetical protein